MEQVWQQVRPKDSLVVRTSTRIDPTFQEIIAFLYQPIIGAQAFSLWMTFRTAIPPELFESDLFLHAEILNRMDIGIPQFYQARLKLEGIGLLKTFGKKKNEEREFVYELQKPMAPEAFFRDEVLSLSLLEIIGQDRFKRLINRFKQPEFEQKDFEDLTHKFVDVYSFRPEKMKAYEKELSKANQLFQPVTTTKLELNSKETFDWAFFLSLINGGFIDKQDMEERLRKSILMYHHLYGINELEMQQFVEDAADSFTQKINEKTLRQAIYIKYHKKEKQKKNYVSENPNIESNEQGTYRKNSLKLEGFSDQEIEVIVSSETIAPMLFLTSIKKQKGGYVTQDERWAVENIKKYSGLPDSVINVLIHYVLVVQNNPTFNQKYADAIANSWSQSSVYSPEASMKKVKEMVNVSKEKAKNSKQTTYQKKYTNSASTRKETLPDWATQEQNIEETPMSAEQLAYFKERMNKIKPQERGDK